MSRVVVGMSGGVDSSVAAALLKQQGYEVTGVTMRIWDGESAVEGKRHGCYGPGEEEDIADAQRVARILGIPLHIVDLTKEYKAEVLDYFCSEYMSGRTPNPCVRCNRRVKFDALLRKARESGITFDYFATGHYAQIEYVEASKRWLLKKARDLTKDQSYFLFALSQAQLGRSLFPVGGYKKDEVRKLAADFGLGVDKKPESQDFAGAGYSPLAGSVRPGPMLDKQGHMLGKHRGIQFYTIGQRKGMGISAAEPLYVTGIDAGRKAIIVGPKADVYGDELIASNLNWIEFDTLEQPIELKAKIRYRHREGDAVVTPLSGGEVYVKFAQPQMAITPGQAVVFYKGSVVVGGGTIERSG
jgi:tRNA-uridine 2-sulfurtransferase